MAGTPPPFQFLGTFPLKTYDFVKKCILKFRVVVNSVSLYNVPNSHYLQNP